MKVAVYYNNRDVRIEERPVPTINPQELLVRIRSSGICGSDVMEWYRIKKAPLVLGHEIAGEIVEKGNEVHHYQVGDRVFVSHHVPCNTCRYCLKGQHTACETLHTTNFDPGGFSEFIRVPEINVDRGTFVLPAEISFDQGSFIEPLGCTIRAQRLAGFRPGNTVLILGSGIAGALHILLAKAQGAGKIIATDIDEYRLECARKFGADIAISARDDIPAMVRKVNENRGADLVILCTGAPPAFPQAVECVDRGGTILFFATPSPEFQLPLRVADIWRNEVHLLSSYGASPLDLQISIELIRNQRVPVQNMITHILPLVEAQQGFQLVSNPKNSMKVILQP